MKSLIVNAPSGAYEVRVENGLITEIGRHLTGILPTQTRIMVIADRNVGKLYGDKVVESLIGAGYDFRVFNIPPGEMQKSLGMYAQLFDVLLMMGIDRTSALVALGGGVVGDLVGFVAATFMRGVPFVQVPTSLLAQVDSSVGGKVAVNHPVVKNLVGTFYQPVVVLADPQVLYTLPNEEYVAGLGEVVKYGMIRSLELFAYLEQRHDAVLSLDPRALEHVVSTCIAIKADIVAADEREKGLRAILNFGHTVAHALEAATAYSKFRHGEAVAIGLMCETRLAVKLGLAAPEVEDRLGALLGWLGLPTKQSHVQPDQLVHLMLLDKKVSAGRMRFALPKAIGEAIVVDDVKTPDVLTALG
ncbi:MAG: 3-dehydroquinate synthase [Planctomycetota bacterium]|nr:3-dehydroquinate synthase [Planctomycetota bacterium]